MNDNVDHPYHYGGCGNPYETINVIEAWDLGFCLGNAVKYISRAGKKSSDTEIEDLKKAIWYIERRIQELNENDMSKGMLRGDAEEHRGRSSPDQLRRENGNGQRAHY